MSDLKAVTSRIKLGACENRRLSWVMITVSSITKIPLDTLWYMPHFLNSCKLALNLPHYITSYMHHTDKKESKKEILKKGKKFASRGFKPGPSESVKTKR